MSLNSEEAGLSWRFQINSMQTDAVDAKGPKEAGNGGATWPSSSTAGSSHMQGKAAPLGLNHQIPVFSLL